MLADIMAVVVAVDGAVDGIRMGWGYGGWLWGATAAIIAGAWLFGGYTWDQWQEMADEDDEKRVYYETVVTPAYQQYQQNPESIPVRD